MHTNANTNAVAKAIAQLLANTVGTTFAQIVYYSTIALSAKNKHNVAYKLVTANVQLCNNVVYDLYTRQVQRSANAIDSNDAQDVANFVASETYYTHANDCYALAVHKTNGTQYLYCIPNNAKSAYYLNNAVSSKEEIAALCTPSAAKAMLTKQTTVHNVTNNITHTVIPKLIKLAHVVSITVNKQTVHFN
jgi:hypothetical protein